MVYLFLIKLNDYFYRIQSKCWNYYFIILYFILYYLTRVENSESETPTYNLQFRKQCNKKKVYHGSKIGLNLMNLEAKTVKIQGIMLL